MSTERKRVVFVILLYFTISTGYQHIEMCSSESQTQTFRDSFYLKSPVKTQIEFDSFQCSCYINSEREFEIKTLYVDFAIDPKNETCLCEYLIASGTSNKQCKPAINATRSVYRTTLTYVRNKACGEMKGLGSAHIVTVLSNKTSIFLNCAHLWGEGSSETLPFREAILAPMSSLIEDGNIMNRLTPSRATVEAQHIESTKSIAPSNPAKIAANKKTAEQFRELFVVSVVGISLFVMGLFSAVCYLVFKFVHQHHMYNHQWGFSDVLPNDIHIIPADPAVITPVVTPISARPTTPYDPLASMSYAQSNYTSSVCGQSPFNASTQQAFVGKTFVNPTFGQSAFEHSPPCLAAAGTVSPHTVMFKTNGAVVMVMPDHLQMK